MQLSDDTMSDNAKKKKKIAQLQLSGSVLIYKSTCRYIIRIHYSPQSSFINLLLLEIDHKGSVNRF